MRTKTAITPRSPWKYYAPKTVSAKYPAKPDTSLAELRRKTKDAKARAAAKAIRKPKPKAYAVTTKVISAGELKILKEVFRSNSSALEIFNQSSMPGEYAGIVASVMAVSRYAEMQADYKRKLGSARTSAQKDKVEARWKQIDDSFRYYFAVGGCSNISEDQLNAMMALVSRDPETTKIVDEINKQSRLVKTTSAKIKVLRAAFEIADTSYANTSVAIDTVISSLADICDFDVTITYTHPILINKPFEFTTPLWCPTWDDWDRTCEVVVLGGRLRVLLNLEIAITLGCFGVHVSGTAIADGCLEDFYSQLPTVAEIIPNLRLCGQCWAVAEQVSVTSKFVGQGGNCTFGLVIQGTTGCNVPLIPLAAGNFTLSTEVNAPCGVSAG